MSKPKPWKADELTYAVAAHLIAKAQQAFPNVEYGGFVADLLVLNEAGFAVEFETKCTLSDWKIDSLKSTKVDWMKLPPGCATDLQQRFPERVPKYSLLPLAGTHKRFYFIMPATLWAEGKWELSEEQFPDWAGVYTVARTLAGDIVVRRAKECVPFASPRKVPPAVQRELMDKMYWRYWKLRGDLAKSRFWAKRNLAGQKRKAE